MGVEKFYPENFERGDFKKLLDFIDMLFESVLKIIKISSLGDLEDKLLKLKSDLEAKIIK
ncbi:MAG: hypothetical protein ACTSYQ_01145 [Candidatus Odinarchaeia archaeon]